LAKIAGDRFSVASFWQALVAATFGLFIFCCFLLAVEYFPQSLLGRLREVEPFLWAVFTLSALAFVLALSRATSLLLRWGNSRALTSLDLGVICFALCAATVGLSSNRPTPPRGGVVLTAGGAIFCILVLRLVLAIRRPPVSPVAPPLFDRVLGPEGLAPMESLEDDALGRHALATALEDLISQPRRVSLTFAVEGMLGSGKTTMLHDLRGRLRRKGMKPAWLDAWSYREPERILQAYFRRVREAIGETLVAPGLGSQLRRLARGLAPLAGRGIGAVLGDLARFGEDEDVEKIRQKLRKLLEQARLPIVVIVDDLDRIEAAELRAILRAVRLVSDLPNLTHVLAYDRAHLARLLFPTDTTGTLARDFIAKVVNAEIRLSPPPRALAFGLLSAALTPLMSTLPRDVAEDFAEQMSRAGSTLVMTALPTPREIRRVAAATAWVYSQLQRHVNVFDLFVLSILQYRFPAFYDRIRSRPIDFAAGEWSSDLEIAGEVLAERLGTREPKEKRRKVREQLREAQDREADTAVRLVDVIFPIDSRLSEAEARLGRRALHPDVLPRYFQLYLEPGTVTELEMEEFAQAMAAATTSKSRQSVVVERMEAETSKGRIHQFLSLWYLVFGDRQLKAHPPELLRDIAVGLAKVSDALPADSDVFTQSARGRAAATAVVTLLDVPSGKRRELLREVVEAASNLPFAIYFLAGSEGAARDRGRTTDFAAEAEEARRVLERRFVETYRRGPGRVLDAPKGDRAMLVFRAPNLEVLSAAVEREVASHPESLIRLLELVLLPPYRDESDRNLKTLADLLDLRKLAGQTEELPAEALPNEIDRAILQEFRDWIARTAGSTS
jgi:KAP-like P-loop domain-containing protein